jgi:hypothetical protein
MTGVKTLLVFLHSVISDEHLMGMFCPSVCLSHLSAKIMLPSISGHMNYSFSLNSIAYLTLRFAIGGKIKLVICISYNL